MEKYTYDFLKKRKWSITSSQRVDTLSGKYADFGFDANHILAVV
jgi:hypothetical protein